MRSIKQTSAFKKCLKREIKGKYRLVIIEELPVIVTMLANDLDLPDKYQDHALISNWQGYKECHIRPDFLLIYMKVDAETTENNIDEVERKEGELWLVRLGTHSELF